MSNEVTEAVKKPPTVLERIKQPAIKERLQQALGKKANIEEFLSNVLVEIGKNERLMNCTFDSVLQCAIDSANFGLIPNKQLGHAFLIPFENSYKEGNQWHKRMECQLQIGYKGYIKKFAEYGMSIEVELVTHEEIEKGLFEESRGSVSYIKHKPIRSGIRDAKNIALGYAIGKCAGRADIMAVMSLEEILEAAKTEQWDKEAGKKVKSLKGAWVNNARTTDLAEMCKKTLIRRVAKISDIDVVNKISAYEGERDSALKDVTPNDNDSLKVAFLENTNNQSSIAVTNKLDELLSGYKAKEEKELLPLNLSAAEIKCYEIIELVRNSEDKGNLESIINRNETHILAMEMGLQDKVYATIDEKKKTF